MFDLSGFYLQTGPFTEVLQTIEQHLHRYRVTSTKKHKIVRKSQMGNLEELTLRVIVEVGISGSSLEMKFELIDNLSSELKLALAQLHTVDFH